MFAALGRSGPHPEVTRPLTAQALLTFKTLCSPRNDVKVVCPVLCVTLPGGAIFSTTAFRHS